jgi:hypothetical protein
MASEGSFTCSARRPADLIEATCRITCASFSARGIAHARIDPGLYMLVMQWFSLGATKLVILYKKRKWVETKA